MDSPTQSRHTGRKIWYAVAIALCGLVILLSSAFIVGDWIIQDTLSKTAVSLLQVVYDSAGGMRQVVQRVDQGAGEVRQISSEVSQVSLQISQNIEEKGLIALLLPEEKENQLAERINSIQETFSTIREVLASSLEMYRAIDSLPFVNLPGASQEQITKVEAAIAQSQTDFAELRQSVQDFRTAAAGQVDRVTQAADKVTARMDELSGDMNNLDADLVALQEFATRMQTTIPRALFVIALVITIFLVWVIYTQVEVIRLFVRRWKLLGETQAVPMLEADQTLASLGEENPE
jgi:hypothetical protein